MKRHLFRAKKKVRIENKNEKKIQLRMIYRKSSRANTYEWKFAGKIGAFDEFSDHRLIGSLPSLICQKLDKMAVSQSRKKLTNIPPPHYTCIKLLRECWTRCLHVLPAIIQLDSAIIRRGFNRRQKLFNFTAIRRTLPLTIFRHFSRFSFGGGIAAWHAHVTKKLFSLSLDSDI